MEFVANEVSLEHCSMEFVAPEGVILANHSCQIAHAKLQQCTDVTTMESCGAECFRPETLGGQVTRQAVHCLLGDLFTPESLA